MRASFLHIADTHLGYEQYGVKERFNDFSRAFWSITDEAIERRVDFLLIAGDLFHKRAIDALTLIHTIEGLRNLKEKHIPVVVIEGNHDRGLYRDGTSWLQFLSHQGYLHRLHPVIENGRPVIAPWNPATMLGSHIDLLDGELRIYGIPWQGSSTNQVLEGMIQSLHENYAEEISAGIKYRILAMHTGIDGMVARVQGMPTQAQFQPLYPYIDYLALGHVHKPEARAGWIYNPGSIETCSAEEAQWNERGYYYVEIDTDEPQRIIDPEQKERQHHAVLMANKRRPFVRHEIRVDGLLDPSEIYQRVQEYCHREGPHHRNQQAPVVLLQLTGTFAFDTSAINIRRLEEIINDAFSPIFVRIDNQTNDQDYIPDEGGIDGRDRHMWYELERKIFEELVGMDSRYLPAKEEWSAVIRDMKNAALHKEDPAEIARYLRNQRLKLFHQ